MNDIHIRAVILGILCAAAITANLAAGIANYRRESWSYSIANFCVASFLSGILFFVLFGNAFV